jgi:hypothetical protein
MAAIVGCFVSVLRSGPENLHFCDVKAVINENLWDKE